MNRRQFKVRMPDGSYELRSLSEVQHYPLGYINDSKHGVQSEACSAASKDYKRVEQ